MTPRDEYNAFLKRLSKQAAEIAELEIKAKEMAEKCMEEYLKFASKPNIIEVMDWYQLQMSLMLCFSGICLDLGIAKNFECPKYKAVYEVVRDLALKKRIEIKGE